jgi:hypothetical protein
MKAGYITHVMEEKNKIASHCRIQALSDDTDPNFSRNCDHDHSDICEDCLHFVTTLSKVKTLVENSDHIRKHELNHEVKTSIESIMNWQKHIIRGSQQEFSKKVMFEKLGTGILYWLRDFGMKIIPKKFREKQVDWFGKKGITNHIDCVYSADENGQITKVTYVTFLDNCTQDTYAVLCIFKHVLEQVRVDFPGATTIYDRSDNAGCYSTANCIAGKLIISII